MVSCTDYCIYIQQYLFALIDGNNFYVSCERAFNPRLQGLPVIVLSNKQLSIKNSKYALKPANENYPTFDLEEGQVLEIWGVVMAAVTELHHP